MTENKVSSINEPLVMDVHFHFSLSGVLFMSKRSFLFFYPDACPVESHLFVV